jgi:TAT (twin-arginine translocation) pathway signal sequence
MQKKSDLEMSRRSFVKATAVAGVMAAGFPAIVGAQDKSATKPIIMGTGDHTYEWVDNWGKLPDGKKFGNTHAVVETADGSIYIHNMSPTGDATCVFDPDGNFITSWGKEFAGGAHGMDLRKEDGKEFLYLAPTTMHKVFKTTLDGKVLMELDYPKQAVHQANGQPIPDYKDEKKYVPTFIALPDTGDFYVADGYGSNYVHRYNNKGEYVQSWGGTGKEPGQFRTPHGIWVDTRGPDPLLVVADRSNVRLQWFDYNGKFIKMVTDELRHPCMFDQRGGDLLIPDLMGRVTLFDKDNKLICHLGDNPNKKEWANNGVKQKDTQPGIFCTPHSARFDSKGNIFVVEWLPYGRVTKLKKVSA